MSKETSIRILVALGGTCLGVVVTIAVSLWITSGMGESPDQAYERGYEDARSVLLDTLYSRWFNDSLGWGSEIDSNDTMPAVKAAWDSRTKPTILWDTGGVR